MKKVIVLGVIFFMNTFFINCQTFYSNQNNNKKIEFKVKKSEKEWKDELTPKEFDILRNKGTERPYTGVYNMHFEKVHMNVKVVAKLYLKVIISLFLIVGGQVMKVLFLELSFIKKIKV